MRRLDQTVRLLKIGLAAGLSWYLASLVSPHRMPYFAPLAVVITFQATVAETLAKAWYRIAGIVGGVVLALLISTWFHVGPVTIGLAVLAGLAMGTAFRLEAQIINQIGVTVVMVLASAATPHYAQYRVFESLLGAVVGIGVNALVLPPNGLPLAEERVLQLAQWLAGGLRGLASGNLAVGALEGQLSGARQAVRAAESSLKLNPFGAERRARLRQLKADLGVLEEAVAQVRRLGQGLHEVESDLSAPLEDAAECVAAFGEGIASPSAEAQQRLRAAVARAESSQLACLCTLKETASLPELRDVAAVLADLGRLVVGLQMDRHHADPQLAMQPSVIFSHD